MFPCSSNKALNILRRHLLLPPLSPPLDSSASYFKALHWSPTLCQAHQTSSLLGKPSAPMSSCSICARYTLSLASDSINWQGLCVARRAPTLYQAWKRHARRLVPNGPKINIGKVKCQNLLQKLRQTKFARANVKIREHIT